MIENPSAAPGSNGLVASLAAISLFLLLSVSAACADARPVAGAPNILVIVADQMRRPAMGFWQAPEYTGALNGASDPVVTPNIDALAAEGIVFSQAIANFPLCSPFRAMLLSGLYPNKNGVSNNTRKDRDVGLRTDIETLPEVLRKSGYDTGLVGKAHWHRNLPLFDANGDYQGTTDAPGGHYVAQTDFDTYVPPGPPRHGFDYWYQSLTHDHQNPVIYSNDADAIDGKSDGQQHQKQVYSSVDQADRILAYLDSGSGKRDPESPFFLWWALDPPHGPYDSIEDTDEEIYDRYYKHKPIDELLNRPNVDRELGARHIRYYLSMVTLIDREIGRVVEKLKEEGLYENTIIVFTSDHGEMMGSHGETGKNKVHEEALGIPFILTYPERLDHRLDDLLFGIPDVMPTLLGLSGLSDRTPGYVQGRDLSAQLLDPETDVAIRPESSFYYGPKGEVGVRTDRYTYAIGRDGELAALYDNVADPYQLDNLSLRAIPKQDRVFLKSQLGLWLCSTDHDWNRARPHKKMIRYPDNDCGAG